MRVGRVIAAVVLTTGLTGGVCATWVGIVDGPGYERCGQACESSCSPCNTTNTIVRGQ